MVSEMWYPSSPSKLKAAEEAILSKLKEQVTFEATFVELPDGNQIRTIIIEPDSKNAHPDDTPFVLIHGMGAGIGFWVLNYSTYSKTMGKKVYAIDILGFGRSSRSFGERELESLEPENIDDIITDSIESWRKKLNIQKMILMCHSFGGYIGIKYAVKFPSSLAHLLLLDPWGVADEETYSTNPRGFRVGPVLRSLAKFYSRFNPLSVIRGCGAFGPSMIRRFRRDITSFYEHLLDDDTITRYIYHCNAQIPPTGEIFFKKLSKPLGWSKNPAKHDVSRIDKNIPITFIYGERSWMNHQVASDLKNDLPDHQIAVYHVPEAGHHFYAENYEAYHTLIVDLFS